MQNLLFLASNNLAPQLYARFSNGFIYGFVPGNVYTVKDMRDPHRSLLVARTMTTWHKLDGNTDKTPLLFPTIRKWVNAVPAAYEKVADQAKFTKCVDMKRIQTEVSSLYRCADRLNLRIGRYPS